MGAGTLSPSVYLEYLREHNWVSRRNLQSKMILSYMPKGLPDSVWEAGNSEKFFQARIRHLDRVEVLSGFGFGGPAARVHLALAIEAGVKEVISVGTVGALSDELNIGDKVLLKSGGLDTEILDQEMLPQVETSTLFDLWESPRAGAEVVEMEAETLFAWCQERGVLFSAIGVVSDLLYKEAWKPCFHDIDDSLGAAHRLAYGVLNQRG